MRSELYHAANGEAILPFSLHWMSICMQQFGWSKTEGEGTCIPWLIIDKGFCQSLHLDIKHADEAYV